MARYDGPPDSYWDPPDDPPDSGGCEGGGHAAGCDGCDDCVVDVTTTRLSVARKARGVIRVGDQIRRTTGFSYQRGGGPRLGYISQASIVGLGPAHHPALQGLGWRGTYPHPLPPEAVERDALQGRASALANVGYLSAGSVHSADTLHRALEDAVALRAEVEAYLSRQPEEVVRALRVTLTSGLDYAVRNIPLALGRIAEAQARVEAMRVRSERLAAWQATGVALKPRGSVIVWEGREYVIGDSWTRLVVHSGLEVDGELVDCTAVGVLDLNDPATGRTVLQWDRRWDLPTPVAA